MPENATDNRDAMLVIFEQTNLNFRSLWALYMRFYTVFLTINIAGLGVASKLDAEAEKLVAVIFIVFGGLSAITALSLACQTCKTSVQLESIVDQLCGQASANGSQLDLRQTTVIPTAVGVWAGIANAIASSTFVFCWQRILGS